MQRRPQWWRFWTKVSSITVQFSSRMDSDAMMRCGEQLGANCNDERAEAAVRGSQVTNPGLDIAFRRGGEAMEGSGMPPPGSGLGDGDLKEGGSWAPSTD